MKKDKNLCWINIYLKKKILQDKSRPLDDDMNAWAVCPELKNSDWELSLFYSIFELGLKWKETRLHFLSQKSNFQCPTETHLVSSIKGREDGLVY